MLRIDQIFKNKICPDRIVSRDIRRYQSAAEEAVSEVENQVLGRVRLRRHTLYLPGASFIALVDKAVV